MMNFMKFLVKQGSVQSSVHPVKGEVIEQGTKEELPDKREQRGKVIKVDLRRDEHENHVQQCIRQRVQVEALKLEKKNTLRGRGSASKYSF